MVIANVTLSQVMANFTQKIFVRSRTHNCGLDKTLNLLLPSSTTTRRNICDSLLLLNSNHRIAAPLRSHGSFLSPNPNTRPNHANPYANSNICHGSRGVPAEEILVGHILYTASVSYYFGLVLQEIGRASCRERV